MCIHIADNPPTFSLRPTCGGSTLSSTTSPQSWPTLPLPCGRASSSATRCSPESRWSCKIITLPALNSRVPDELREKLADLYKSNKDQVSVFGFRTQYGGGKSTGFALVYDSQEALKKFEPHYRLVRIGAATKIEKASRQQQQGLTCIFSSTNRQAKEEPLQEVPRNRQGQGPQEEQGLSAYGPILVKGVVGGGLAHGNGRGRGSSTLLDVIIAVVSAVVLLLAPPVPTITPIIMPMTMAGKI
ncbi:ribosomal 40S subunit protein S24B [Aspergillus wentii]|nr:ribosomal 40S subunit protein S24B [Aspergillus wentii]